MGDIVFFKEGVDGLVTGGDKEADSGFPGVTVSDVGIGKEIGIGMGEDRGTVDLDMGTGMSDGMVGGELSKFGVREMVFPEGLSRIARFDRE